MVVDDSKLVDRLGVAVPVPVEVANFGWNSTARQLEALGAKVTQRLDRSGNVFVTDGGNMILDCHFGEIADSDTLQNQLDRVVGVIETGLFIGRTSEVIVATADGLQRLHAA